MTFSGREWGFLCGLAVLSHVNVSVLYQHWFSPPCIPAIDTWIYHVNCRSAPGQGFMHWSMLHQEKDKETVQSDSILIRKMTVWLKALLRLSRSVFEKSNFLYAKLFSVVQNHKVLNSLKKICMLSFFLCVFTPQVFFFELWIRGIGSLFIHLKVPRKSKSMFKCSHHMCTVLYATSMSASGPKNDQKVIYVSVFRYS